MKVMVPVKRVVDYNVKVRVKSDGSGVDIANAGAGETPVAGRCGPRRKRPSPKARLTPTAALP